MPPTLYRRQRQILDFVKQYIQKNGCSPTLQEIADAIGVSSLATVHEHLQTMSKKGVIKRFEGSVRGIDVVGSKNVQLTAGIELPIMGLIAAGSPIEPYPENDSSLFVSPTMLSGKKRAFVLKVKGDSMIEEGILDGDYVVLEEQETANNGEIVVAILENGFATLKKFYREATRVRLEPANSKMGPIFAKNVKIKGRLAGVIRRYSNS